MIYKDLVIKKGNSIKRLICVLTGHHLSPLDMIDLYQKHTTKDFTPGNIECRRCHTIWGLIGNKKVKACTSEQK